MRLDGLHSILIPEDQGGIGMTDEYDIGFYTKRGRVLAGLFGDSHWAADQLARMGGY